MTLKQKTEEIIKMRAAGNPANLEDKTKSSVIFALDRIVRGNEDEIADSTLVKNLAGTDGEALIPYQLVHDLNEKKKQNKSIRQFIDVVPVKTEKGTFATEDETNANKELVEFESGASEIQEQDLKLKGMEWNIKSYGSFTPIYQQLIEDAEYDLFNFFMDNHAEKAAKTENKKAFNAITTGLSAKALTDVEALSSSLNSDFDPALENEIVVITNQDGFKALKSDVEFFKDENGRPKPFLGKYPVETYSNNDLPSAVGTAPVIYGALKRSVKLFDLEHPEVLLIKHPFGIRSTTSIFRGIEHFDVKLTPDSTQTIYGEIDVS